MDEPLPFIGLMQYPRVTSIQNNDLFTSMAEEIPEHYILETRSNAAAPLIFSAGTEPLFPVTILEQPYLLEMTMSTPFGSFENPGLMNSAGNVAQYEGNTELDNPERSLGASSKPIRRANNPTGRTGKLLCSQCRAWRVKCEYESVELPCQRCLGKGRRCGSKMSPKEWRSQQNINSQRPEFRFDLNNQLNPMMLSHQPQTPLPESVDQSDATHIQWLQANQGLFGFSNLQFFRTDGHRFWRVVVRRFGADLSSYPVRYGCILYSLYKQKEAVHKDTHRALYLDLFHRSTREAVKQKEVQGLVYGCFAGCMYSLRTGRDFQEVRDHAQGFLACISQFSETPHLETEEIFLLECMTEKLLWECAQRHFINANWSTDDLTKITDFLEASLPCWKRKEKEPRWIKDSSSELSLKLKFVKTIIQLYRHRHYFKNTDTIKASLLYLFSRDFVTPIETQICAHASRHTLAHLRSLSRTLWSIFLDIVSDLVAKASSTEALYQRTDYTILALRSIIDLIPEPQDMNGVEIQHLLDVISYCMVLVRKYADKLVAESQIVLDSTRCCYEKLSKNRTHGPLFKSSFTKISGLWQVAGFHS